MRVRFLRTACPACWLLDVSRLIASRMVFRAQGESPAPRSWKRRATCSRRVVRRVCSELIMSYRKLTILDFETPLAATRLPTRRLATSLSRASNFPLARLATSLSRASRLPSRAPRASSGTFKSRLEKRVGARGARLAHPTGTLAFGEAPSPGPTRRREAPSACSHWEAAPLPCARHFLWGTFLLPVKNIPLRSEIRQEFRIWPQK